MTIDQIKAELRRSACEDAWPFDQVSWQAFNEVVDKLKNWRTHGENVGSLSNDDCRTLFLLVAEAIE
jgi:hypothetical protein